MADLFQNDLNPNQIPAIPTIAITPGSQQSVAHEPGFGKWLVDYSNELNNFAHRLKGHKMELNNKGQLEWKEDPKAFRKINDDGVAAIIRKMSVIANKNTFVSNTTTDSVNRLGKLVSNSINDELFENYAEYEIKGSYAPILVDCMVLVEMSLNRALNGSENVGLFKTQTEQWQNDINQQQQQPAPGGFFSTIAGLGRKTR